ncbi:unnamed protein product [Sphenostylis stenocarpa]|uniref:Uncharacterized protein n=1 Tax=Sphenostylis stenocarpa TaxID=92480 RepID=A0AA86VNP0_9FABA|nr:unnamed protein product [Sphenostylis stenocarpa]
MVPPPTDNYWDAEIILQMYLHDYMIKRGMHNTAEIFKKEAQVPNQPVRMQEKNQDFGSTSSSKVPTMTHNARNNVPLRIPEISTNDKRISQHINSRFHNMMSGSTIFATSSFDRSVKLWDAGMGGTKQVRFQPYSGDLLTTATENNIKIVDVETNSLLHSLEGHTKDVISICWNKNGNYIASVSEDCARVWSLDGKCISELHSDGNKFQSCIFHPAYSNLLIIGGYQTMELWSPTESSKTWIVPAHNGLITGLADSSKNELVASASHDQCVKLWK